MNCTSIFGETISDNNMYAYGGGGVSLFSSTKKKEIYSEESSSA